MRKACPPRPRPQGAVGQGLSEIGSWKAPHSSSRNVLRMCWPAAPPALRWLRAAGTALARCGVRQGTLRLAPQHSDSTGAAPGHTLPSEAAALGMTGQQGGASGAQCPLVPGSAGPGGGAGWTQVTCLRPPTRWTCRVGGPGSSGLVFTSRREWGEVACRRLSTFTAGPWGPSPGVRAAKGSPHPWEEKVWGPRAGTGALSVGSQGQGQEVCVPRHPRLGRHEQGGRGRGEMPGCDQKPGGGRTAAQSSCDSRSAAARRTSPGCREAAPPPKSLVLCPQLLPEATDCQFVKSQTGI